MVNNEFVVIVKMTVRMENQTGILYHYPKRYSKYLKKGTLAIYYKGKLRNRKFEKPDLQMSLIILESRRSVIPIKTKIQARTTFTTIEDFDHLNPQTKGSE